MGRGGRRKKDRREREGAERRPRREEGEERGGAEGKEGERRGERRRPGPRPPPLGACGCQAGGVRIAGWRMSKGAWLGGSREGRMLPSH